MSPDAENVGPPPTNRGAGIPTWDEDGSLDPGYLRPTGRFGRSIDWYAGTVRGIGVPGVEKLLTQYVPGVFRRLPHGLNSYLARSDGPGGAKILSQPADADAARSDEVHVILPGTWCKAAGEPAMRGWLLWMSTNKARATRIDVAIDDWERAVAPSEVWDAKERGDIVTKAKHKVLTRDGSDGAPPGADTVNVGSRSSRVMLRVYDKRAQAPRAGIDAIRWELELKAEAAEQAQHALAVKSWPGRFGSYLVRFIDFRDRLSDANTTRRRQLSWWAEFVDGCAKAEAYMPVPVISAARTEAWIEKQAAPSLAAVFANKGGDMDYLQELLTEGRKRWGEKHRMIADGLV